MKHNLSTDLVFLLCILTLFKCSFATNINALKGLRLNQQINTNQSNDEVGGTLLSLVAPKNKKAKSSLFTSAKPTQNVTPAPTPTTTDNTKKVSLTATTKTDPLKDLGNLKNQATVAKADASAAKTPVPTPTKTPTPKPAPAKKTQAPASTATAAAATEGATTKSTNEISKLSKNALKARGKYHI